MVTSIALATEEVSPRVVSILVVTIEKVNWGERATVLLVVQMGRKFLM